MAFTLPKRNFTRNKWRTFLIILGISISVGLETGIAISVDTLYNDFIDNHRGNNFTDISVYSNKNSTLAEMQELESKVQNIKGVEISSLVATFTLLDPPSFITDRPELENISNTVIIYGLKPDSHPDFPQLQVERGNKTLNAKEEEVIISDSIASLLHLSPGSDFYFPKQSSYSFLGAVVKISGVMNDQIAFGNYVGFLFILTDFDYLVSLFTNNSILDFHLAVKVNDFININSIAQRIEDTLGLDYLVFREKSISETDFLGIRSYQVAMNLIIIASFVVEFLFISNILTINIRERSKEFGVLRAIGSSKKQVILFLGLEIIFYSGIGSSIGSLIGIGFSYVIVFFLNLNYTQTVAIDALLIMPASLFATFITGMLIALISGLYPIVVAINLPVVQNIHWKMRTKKTTSRNWMTKIVTGILLVLLGFITTYFIGPSRFLTYEIISLHFLVIGLIFLGSLILETGFLHFAPQIGRRVMLWHKKVPRIIATRNIQRESQKSILTIMVTALALTFILVVGVVSDGIISTLPEYYDERFGRIDIIAETHDDVQVLPSFTNELETNNSNILRAGFIQQQRTTIGSFTGYVFGIDTDAFDYFFSETMIMPVDSDIPVLLNSSERGVVLSHFLISSIGVRIGDDITVNVSVNESTQFKVTGIIAGNPFLQRGNYLFCSEDLFHTLWQNQSASWFIMSTGDEIPLKTMEEQLCIKYPIFSRCIAIDFYSAVIENALIIQKTFFQALFLHTFLLSGLAQFISILVSTLKTEREVGIMRSMGLSKGGVFSIFLAESTILGILAVILGLINGIIGAELMVWYISQSLPIKTSFSGNMFLFWIIFSLIITVSSTIIPTYRSSNKSIIEAINSYIPRQLRAAPILWKDWDNMIDGILLRRNENVDSLLSRKLMENDIEE